MTSFQSKKGTERARNERKKKLSFLSVPSQSGIKNSKKIAKKFKNINMASFKAKMGQDRLRLREKKNWFRSNQTRPEKGNSKKVAKN